MPGRGWKSKNAIWAATYTKSSRVSFVPDTPTNAVQVVRFRSSMSRRFAGSMAMIWTTCCLLKSDHESCGEKIELKTKTIADMSLERARTLKYTLNRSK